MNQLKDFEPWLNQAMHFIARETSFSSRPGLAEVLQANPQLVIAFSHATPLSWFPAISLITAHACARGGGARKPVGIMDHMFYQLPIMNRVAQLLGQSEKPHTFDGLIDAFKENKHTDLVVFPEGSNCFFGEPDEIQDFRSPRFMEFAIRLEIPVLICVHRGSESWAKTFPVAPEMLAGLNFLPELAVNFLSGRLQKSGKISVPSWPAPMDKFSMICELYYPKLKATALLNDKAERRQQLQVESEFVRERMLQLLLELDQKS